MNDHKIHLNYKNLNMHYIEQPFSFPIEGPFSSFPNDASLSSWLDEWDHNPSQSNSVVPSHEGVITYQGLTQQTMPTQNVFDATMKEKTDLEKTNNSSVVREKPKKKPRSWTKEEDISLLEQIQINGNNWDIIARQCGDGTRSGKDCRQRYFFSLDPNIDKSKWTEDETKKLKLGIQRYGHKWEAISKNIFQGKRTSKTCGKMYKHKLLRNKIKKAVPKVFKDPLKEIPNDNKNYSVRLGSI
jgi:Myb-like DNA-binding domain